MGKVKGRSQSGKFQIGYTGTRHGLSHDQSRRLFSYLHAIQHEVERAHHGCCVGGDAEFHEMCQILGIPVRGHPPADHRFYAKNLVGFESIATPNDYHTRDRHVVNAAGVVFSTPLEKTPQNYSGTWYTTRYAVKNSVPVVLFHPDGSMFLLKGKKGAPLDGPLPLKELVEFFNA